MIDDLLGCVFSRLFVVYIHKGLRNMFQSIVGWWLREFAPPIGNLGQAICSSILFSYSSFWLADMSRNNFVGKLFASWNFHADPTIRPIQEEEEDGGDGKAAGMSSQHLVEV